MTDYAHLKNIIGGAVIQIRERRPLGQQPELLGEMIAFLSGQAMEITIAKRDVMREIRKKAEEATEQGDSDEWRRAHRQCMRHIYDDGKCIYCDKPEQGDSDE